MVPTNYHFTPIELYTPAGIGDALWSLMWVWSNTDRPIRLYTMQRPGQDTQFLKCLPPVISIDMFPGDYESFKKECNKRRKTYLEAENFNNFREVYLALNPWLESNRRLEDYLPQMKFEWDIPWRISEAAEEAAGAATQGQPIIALYTSSMALNRDAEGLSRAILYDHWTLDHWNLLVDQVRRHFKNPRIVFLGGPQDKEVYTWLVRKGHTNIEPWINKPGDYVVALLRKAKCFLSFQSGLSVISVLDRKTPTYMMYFKYVHAVARSWCPPGMINNPDHYHSLLFDDWAPAQMIRWMKKHMPQESWL